MVVVIGVIILITIVNLAFSFYLLKKPVFSEETQRMIDRNNAESEKLGRQLSELTDRLKRGEF
jgi:capsular polysaccharide biosynthesis protein